LAEVIFGLQFVDLLNEMKLISNHPSKADEARESSALRMECLTFVHNEEITRHCEGRRAVAIQAAFSIAPALWKAAPPHGLPRRCAPCNDRAGVGTAIRSSLLTEGIFGLQFIDLL
jgi:hypothetical protein